MRTKIGSSRHQVCSFTSSLSVVIMASCVIKVFEFFQQFHQTIGIYGSESNQKQCSINRRNALFVFCASEFIFTSVAFLVFEAKSMFDYGFGIFALLVVLNSTIIYFLFIWKLEMTLKFVQNCEGFIEKSVYNILNNDSQFIFLHKCESHTHTHIHMKKRLLASFC